jgi:creatinine amidohydrolase
MRFEDLNWMDVEHYLKTDDRLMLVIGACEQHGYLSLLTDIRIPLALADAASEQSGVLVAPPIPVGLSPYFAKYPGTLSLRAQTFFAVIEDLVRGVYAQGFKRLLVLNGHGGNEPAKAVLHELVNDLPELRVNWYSWWVAPAVTAVAESAGLKSNHAAWIEAFPFCRVADLPPGIKDPVTVPPFLSAEATRQAYGDGVFGGPYSADETVMRQIFNAAVSDILDQLKF